MSGETVLTGVAHPTDVYSDAISAALVDSVVLVPLIYSEDLPENTTVKYVRKDGYLTASASAVGEAGNYSTLSQYKTTGVQLTVEKHAVCSFISDEAKRFGGVDEALIARKQGEALARKLDSLIKALFSGFTRTVTATAKLTVDDVMDACFTVRRNLKGAAGRKLTAALEYAGVHELRKELVKSAASVYTIPAMISLLGTPGQSQITANGYVGDLPGCEVFETGGVPTSGADNVQAVFDRDLAIVGIYGRSVETVITRVGSGNPSFGWKIDSYVMHDEVEWNDDAGCGLVSDTAA